MGNRDIVRTLSSIKASLSWIAFWLFLIAIK